MQRKIKSRQILVNEIQFNTRDEIFLLGFIYTQGKFQPTRFVANRRLLYALLKQNGETGNELIALIQQLLKHPHAVPLCIDIVDRFGITQPLKAHAIQMQFPFEEDDFNKQVPLLISTTLFIEQVIPFPSV